MDAVEPPRVVFESAPECADRDRAEELLRQALAQARAKGWVVTVRIQAATLPAASAQAEITDETGAPRGRQGTSGTVADCAGMASAMGAWASALIALDVQRAPSLGAPDSGAPGSEALSLQPLPAPTSAAPPPAPPPAALPPVPAPPTPPPAAGSAPAPVTPPAPRLVRAEMLGPPPAAPSKRDESAPLELGLGTFMMAGGGAGGYVGLAPFLIDDVGQAVFLRPSVAFGESIATNLPSTWSAARLDICMRLPDRYATRGGLQLDLCGGADVGFSYIASGSAPGTPAAGQTVPYVDLGPSVDLRAEVGKFAVTLRGVGGIDVARGGFTDVTGAHVDMPLWSWRFELDFSWVLYNARTESLVADQGLTRKSGAF